MNWLRSHRIVAGVLYLMLAFFAAAVLGLWVSYRPIGSFEEMFPGPEAKRLLLTTLLLFATSACLGVSHFVQPRIGIARVIGGSVPVAIAFTWNVVVGLLWLMPALFTWAAYRQQLATNNTPQADARGAPGLARDDTARAAGRER